MKKKLNAEQVHKVKEIYSLKSCQHCGSLFARVSWWCRNENAIKARGTRIPGCKNCPYWTPDKYYIRQQIKEK